MLETLLGDVDREELVSQEDGLLFFEAVPEEIQEKRRI
jgi:hypothetical protein